MAREKLAPRLLSSTETCNYLGVSLPRLHEMIRDGLIIPVRIPTFRKHYFDREDLDRMIEEWKEGSNAIHV